METVTIKARKGKKILEPSTFLDSKGDLVVTYEEEDSTWAPEAGDTFYYIEANQFNLRVRHGTSGRTKPSFFFRTAEMALDSLEKIKGLILESGR